MANPVPELKGNILEDYPENFLTELDKVLHYLQEQNKGSNLYLRDYSPATIAMVYPQARSKITEFYENVKLVFLKEDFITPIDNRITKHYLTPRGKDFDSFVKARERYIKQYAKNKQTSLWAGKKDMVYILYSIFMTIVTIITTSSLIYKCNTETKNDIRLIQKDKTIDSLGLILKYHKYIEDTLPKVHIKTTQPTIKK